VRILARMLRELRRYTWLLLLTIVLSLVGQAAMVGIPKVIQTMIDAVLKQGRTDMLWSASLTVVGLGLVRWVFGYAEFMVGVRYGQLLMRDMRQTLYEQLTRLSFSYFDRTRTGQLMSRITNDLEPVGDFLTWSSRMMVRTTLLFIGALVVCLTMNWKLALIGLAPLPMLTLTAATAGRFVRPAYERARQLLGEVTTRLQESIGAIMVVKTYCREDAELARFREDSERLRAATYRADAIDSLYFPLTGFWAGLSGLLVLWYGGVLVMNDQLTVGQFLAFNLYVAFLVMPMRMMGWAVSACMRAVAAAGRIYAIQDEVPDLAPPENPEPIGRLVGEVVFDNIAFGYGAERPVLQGISLRIHPGETLGILGPVGSGKSTLAALMPRFYDPDSGRVLIDGHDVRDLDPRELRSQIGVVFQESFLFSGTIRENIAFGKPDASEEEIRAAARDAAILDFIEELPDGLDTPIGERGMRLSGGQQQRIAIARALLTDPRILILDSCTSSVDTYTEYLIQQALDKLMSGRTTIIIAHRASSLAGADRVIVLEEGRIVQDGRPVELARQRDGMFALLDRLQRDLEGLEVA